MPPFVRLGLASLASVSVLLSSASAGAGALLGGGSLSAPVEHRIVVAMGSGKTTIYDQVVPRGAQAGAYAMVFPVKGEAQVGFSSDAMMSVIEAMTRIAVIAPPRNCPPPPPGCQVAPDSTAPEPTATKLKRSEVANPYDVGRVPSSNPDGIAAWLRERGLEGRLRPADKFAFQQLASEGFDFIVMRVDLTGSVYRPRPVRITVEGAVALPISLSSVSGASTPFVWVLAAERYEPTNTPTFTLEDLTWDWSKNTSSFVDQRVANASKLREGKWEVETSLSLRADVLAGAVRSGVIPVEGGPNAPAAPALDDYAQDSSNPDAEESREADLRIALSATDASGNIRATRMRGLSNSNVKTLAFGAAEDQTVLGARVVTKEKGEPLCRAYGDVRVPSGTPGAVCIDGTCSRCEYIGNRPRSNARERAPLPPLTASSSGGGGGGGGGMGCGGRAQIGAGPTPGSDMACAGAGVLAVVGVLARRKRRRG